MVRARSRKVYMPLWSKYIFTILVLLSGIYGWYLFNYLPMIEQEKNLIDQIHALQERQDNLNQVNNQVAKLQQNCDVLSSNIREKIQSKSTLSAQHLFKKILSDSDKSELLLTYCSPLAGSSGEWYKKQRMKFIAAGNFFECIDLLSKIDKYNCFSKIPELTLQKKNDILKMECVVQTYSFE